MRTCVLFLAVALSGCGVATGPNFSGLEDPQSDEAILYVYGNGGKDRLLGSFHYYPCVYIDGEKKDALKFGGYLMYRIAPQPTEVRLDSCGTFSPGSGGLGAPKTSRIDARPSMRYSIKYGFAIVVSEENALPEVQNLKRLN